MSAYDPYDPAGVTWQAWVLYDDGRLPVQLARGVISTDMHDPPYLAVIDHKIAVT